MILKSWWCTLSDYLRWFLKCIILQREVLCMTRGQFSQHAKQSKNWKTPDLSTEITVYPLSSWAIFCNMSSEGGLLEPPPWIFYIKRRIPLYLLTMYSYESSLSIDTKRSTIRLRMTSLWRHNVSPTSTFWTYWKYTQKIVKNRFSAKKRRNMRFSRNFRQNK